MTRSVPASIKAAYHRRRLRFLAEFPERILVNPSPRFMPAPAGVKSHPKARRLSPVWMSSYSDNGTVIRLGPYRELFDDPSSGIHDLTNWYRQYGCVSRPRPSARNRPRWQRYEPVEQLTPEEEAKRRRELAKKLFPLVKKPIRKMLFSEEVQAELNKTFEYMTNAAIHEGRIQDCRADREDYVRTLQYATWGIASRYDASRPGKDGRTPASLTTFVKDALANYVIELKRTRYALKRLGDLFTVPISTALNHSESTDSDAFTMITDEALEDRSTIRDVDEQLDIDALRAYLASSYGKKYERAFNLLVVDGLTEREAAAEIGVPESTFRSAFLFPLRRICRRFGFAPKCK